MRQFTLVQEFHRVAELISDVPHLLQGVRVVIVFLLQDSKSKSRWKKEIRDRRSLTHQEIKDAEAEELEDEAHVAEVVEPVVHDAAKAEKKIVWKGSMASYRSQNK